jgi:hypothetical protein
MTLDGYQKPKPTYGCQHEQHERSASGSSPEEGLPLGDENKGVFFSVGARQAEGVIYETYLVE